MSAATDQKYLCLTKLSKKHIQLMQHFLSVTPSVAQPVKYTDLTIWQLSTVCIAPLAFSTTGIIPKKFMTA
jgi:hypothetical protein